MRAARLRGEHLGDAEVADLDDLLLGEEDVGRLEVAVEHVLVVHVADGGHHLAKYVQHVRFHNASEIGFVKYSQMNL